MEKRVEQEVAASLDPVVLQDQSAERATAAVQVGPVLLGQEQVVLVLHFVPFELVEQVLK